MQTSRGYKLFEYSKGNLYPLFIDKKNPVEAGVWHRAKNEPTKGFAPRPGWHIGLLPDAPWLKSDNGTEKGAYLSQRFRQGQRVWCEVEYVTDIDYRPIVETLPKKCFTDRIPEDGFYTYREAGKGVWIITGAMRINRIISEAERQQILHIAGYNETEAFAPYLAALRKKKQTLESRMTSQTRK